MSGAIAWTLDRLNAVEARLGAMEARLLAIGTRLGTLSSGQSSEELVLLRMADTQADHTARLRRIEALLTEIARVNAPPRL